MKPSGPGAGALAAICAGHSLAYYDLVIFSVMAVQISQAMFPAGDPAVALMQTLGLMGVAYVTRPLGALLLGRMADRRGRRPALMLSFLLAGAAVIGQALVPPYAAIGLAAPALMLALRLLLGFAIGGEFGASVAMLVETAAEGRRGLFVAVQLAAQDFGILIAGMVATMLALLLGPAQLAAYGWRAALLIGGSIVPLGLFLRARLVETIRSDAVEPPVRAERIRAIGTPQMLVVGLLLAALFVADGIKYLGLYAQTVLSLDPEIAFSSTIAISVAALAFSLLGGRMSDRLGRKPVLIAGLALTTLAILPCFWLLMLRPTLGTLVLVSGALASALAFSSPAVVTMLAELMPARSRATTLSLVTAVGVALISGAGDLFFTWVIHVTGAPMAPAWCMSAAALAACGCAVALPETRFSGAQPPPLSRGDIARA